MESCEWSFASSSAAAADADDDGDEWQDTAESFVAGTDGKVLVGPDGTAASRMFFKGVSCPGLSGIGVVVEEGPGMPPAIEVQKRLDFETDELMADYLALMDGLLHALQSGVRQICAFTDSEKLYFQIVETEIPEDQLVAALAHRILELADKLDDFTLTLVPSFELVKPIRLAKEAIGIISNRLGMCSICSQDGDHNAELVKLRCSHEFCLACLTAYIEKSLQLSRTTPIRCPSMRCDNHISAKNVSPFVPLANFKCFQGAISGELYCPFWDCSALIESGFHSDSDSVQCRECLRNVCAGCRSPWHARMTCEEYRKLFEDAEEDASVHRPEWGDQWRLCRQCRRMVELDDGSGNQMTCWCGHEFCYSCGTGYRNGVQTCQCSSTVNLTPDTSSSPLSSQASETPPQPWDIFNSMTNAIELYSEQEQQQLALIQQFLAGEFTLDDRPHCPAGLSLPSGSTEQYNDGMKELRQLPWLERFISVISDTYNEDYFQ